MRLDVVDISITAAAINKLHNTFIFAKTDWPSRVVVGWVPSSVPATTNHSLLLLSASLSLEPTHARRWWWWWWWRG